MNKIEMTKLQLQILKDIIDKYYRYIIFSGATRSGKTVLTFFIMPLLIEKHRQDNIVLIGKTGDTFERNVLSPMRKMFGIENVGFVKTVKNRGSIVKLFNKWCYVIGANNAEATSKIHGMEIGVAVCDEYVLYPEEFNRMLDSRLSSPNSVCVASCNPGSPSHHVKQHIDKLQARLKEDETAIYHKHFCIYDNEFLTKEFVKNLEDIYRGTIYFDRWILGKWVRTEGLVYPLFKRLEHYMTPESYSNKFGNKKIEFVIFGTDGATTNDATAIVPLASFEEQKVINLITY